MKHDYFVGFAVARTEESREMNCEEWIRGGFKVQSGNWGEASSCSSLVRDDESTKDYGCRDKEMRGENQQKWKR